MMFKNLRAMFSAPHEQTVKAQIDPSKCLIEIQLGGKMHRFYQHSIFLNCLEKSIINASNDEFFVYSGETGRYVINLTHVEFVSVAKVASEITGVDLPGYTVFLAGRNTPFILGDLSPDQVSVDFSARTQQFIMLGTHFFKRDEVALIVYKDLTSQQ